MGRPPSSAGGVQDTTARKPPTARTSVGAPGSVNGDAAVVAGGDSPARFVAATLKRYSRPLVSCCTRARDAEETPSSTTVHASPPLAENDTT